MFLRAYSSWGLFLGASLLTACTGKAGLGVTGSAQPAKAALPEPGAERQALAPPSSERLPSIRIPLPRKEAASSTPAEEAYEPYFYHGINYGSELQFNPLTVFVNGAFDINRNPSYSNQLGAIDFSTGFENVFWNLTHPGRALGDGGFDRVVAHEIFPIWGLGSVYGQWLPNYFLHTLGEGMLYRKMSEWYHSRDVPYPRVFSLASLLSMQLINEVVENGSYKGSNADPVVDLLFFNVLGCLLFSTDTVSAFFSGPVELSYWPGQAGIDVKEGRIINQGENYAFKVSLGSWTDWRFFSHMGSSALFGLSIPMKAGDTISLGGGAQLLALKPDPNPGTRILIPDGEMGYGAGLFWDRNESLLASLTLGLPTRPLVMLNVYPGIYDIGKLSVGFFMSAGQYDGMTMGLTFKELPLVPAILAGYDPVAERF